MNFVRTTCVRIAAEAMFYSGALNLIPSSGYRRGVDEQGRTQRDYPFSVLLYHRVNPDNDPFFPAVSVKAFDAQMKYLATHYRVLPLAEIVERVKDGRGILPQTIAVTFDDGYRDNYVFAHPILRKYNLPATLFVATGYVSTEKLMWNDRIAVALKLTNQHKITLPGTLSRNAVCLASTPDKLHALNRILEFLKTFAETDKQVLADEIFARLHSKRLKVEPLMLSWTELRRLAHEGWEIGSHTANHVILTKIPFWRAQEEINSSRSILTRELDGPVRLFAYPNGKTGDYDLTIKKCLSDAGYIGAVTTVDRLNVQDVDLFAIGRKSPWGESAANFALKLKWSCWRPNLSQSQTNRAAGTKRI